jgi:PBSX family phage terminase large subunit
MTSVLAPKQIEFVLNSTRKWNFTHGSVRAGKTNGVTFAFLHAVDQCPDDNIWIGGKSSTTIFNNVINLILNSPQFAIFRPFCTWQGGKNILHFIDSKGRHKKIKTVGIKDKGAIGYIQGSTMSLFYGDEMTLYPQEVISLIDTRLSCPWSRGFGTMNPTFPNHIIKQWIDLGIKGDKNYYSLHFTLDDNPYVDADYKARIAKSSGVFYKRNYLGLWCLAEGAIFDFFDKSLHVVKRAPRNAEYFIAGIDVGTSNAFACLIIGVNTGRQEQLDGPIMWVEREYFWDSKKTGRAKTNLEYANDVEAFLEPYGVKQLYIDPSAAAMKEELRRKNLSPIDANNDVYNGITNMVSMMCDGNLFIHESCENTIREIESYVWDSKASERGEDEPLKQDDHCMDALRYPLYTHKPPVYSGHVHNPQNYLQSRFGPRNF